MSYDSNNIFAKILRGEIPCIKLYEDAHTLAFMDIMPQTDGQHHDQQREGAQRPDEAPHGAAAVGAARRRRSRIAMTPPNAEIVSHANAARYASTS